MNEHNLRKSLSRATRILSRKPLATSLAALAILGLGAVSFLVTRELTVREGAEAQTASPPAPATEIVPADDSTPVPGATPDTRQPGWYVPYLNRDGTLPLFEGELGGIVVGAAATSAGEGRCEGARVEYGPEAESRHANTALGTPQLPSGMTFFQRPAYMVCPDGVSRRLEATPALLTPLPITRLPAGLEPAVGAYVEQNLGEFAGDCQAAVPQQDAGKWCYSLLDESPGWAWVGIARTFSDQGAPAVNFVLAAPGEWRVSSVGPRAPATGTGVSAHPAGSTLRWPVVAGALLVAAGLGALRFSRWRRHAS
jgi:hypothetical protein